MFRRDLKLFSLSFRAMAVLIVLVFGVAVGAFFALSGSETPASIQLDVAVTNYDSDSAIGTMTMNAAINHRMVTSLIHVEFYDTEEEALQAVRDGATAAIIVPKHFFNSVSRGENMPCRLIVNNSGDIEKTLLFMFADIGVELLTTGQLIVFTGDYYMMDQGVSSEIATDFNMYMNLYSISELSHSQDTYLRTVEIPYTRGGLSMAGHYIAVYFAFFLCVILLGLNKLYQTDMLRSRLLMLKTSGITEVRFMLWKCLLPFFTSLVFLLILCLGASRFVPLTFSPLSLLYALLGLLFIQIFGALCSTSFGSASGAVLFAIHVVGLFFCGGVIPYSRLKPIALMIGEFTPLGTAYKLVSPLLGGTFTPAAPIMACVYTALFYALFHARFRQLLSGKEAS